MTKPGGIDRSRAFNFEALKAGYAQTKGGHSLRFIIPTNDLPKEVAEAEIGTRFMVALVVMPDTPEEYEEYSGKRAVQLAGILCKDPSFQIWFGKSVDKNIYKDYDVGGSLEWPVADALRAYLRVGSRSELMSNKRATDKFYELYQQYLNEGLDPKAGG